MSVLSRRAAFSFGWSLMACAPSMPDAYARHVDEAGRAYEQGRYAAAAEHWNEAHRVAESHNDRDEAAYRTAISLRRAGKTDDAKRALERLAKEGRGTRRARAAFELADIEIERGNLETGHEMLRRALLRFPNEGVARNALTRLAAYVVETRGSEAAEANLARLAISLEDSELEATALFERAKLLHARGAEQAALDAFLNVARRFPYPEGAYWDDATLFAAELARSLGRPGQARSLLLDMLDHRESAALTGSYERGYDRATFMLAELELEAGNWQSARQHWVELFDAFEESRLRDDALWAAAKVSRQNDDVGAACALSKRLTDELPKSRFAACVSFLCAKMKPKGRCSDYIKRDVGALR